MFIAFRENYYLPGEFNPKIVDEFFDKYPFISFKELVKGYDEDEKRLYVTYSVYKIKQLGDMPISRNIWCYDKKTGERLWTIEGQKNETTELRIFGGAGFYKDGVFRAHEMGGFDCDVDIETGKITKVMFVK